jgi:hypothetical protein
MNFRMMPEAIGAAGFMLYNYYFTECGNAVDRLTLTQHPSGRFEISGRQPGIENLYLRLAMASRIWPSSPR